MSIQELLRSSLLALLLTGCAPEDDSRFDCDNGKCDTVERCYEFNTECGEGLTCRPVDRDPGSDQFCLPPSTKNDYCDDDDDCQGDRVCLDDGIDNGVCTGVVEEDERCFNFNYECAAGLVCRPVHRSIGSEQFCQPPSAKDAYCDDDDDCAGQRICIEAVTPFDNGTCRGTAKQDSRCYEFNFECAEGLSCRPIREAAGAGQFCLSPSEDGYCDDDGDCAGGSVCVGDDIDNGTCQFI